MSRFADVRDAKDFLVRGIVREAALARVSLTADERSMLYFSESEGVSAELAAANARFEAECNRSEFEEKIAGLIRRARERLRRKDREELRAWTDAIDMLGTGDHYLLVMVERAGIPARQVGDLPHPWALGVVILVGPFLLLYLADRFELGKEDGGGLLWLVAVCTGGHLLSALRLRGAPGEGAPGWVSQVLPGLNVRRGPAGGGSVLAADAFESGVIQRHPAVAP